jgi:hypothetical protein
VPREPGALWAGFDLDADTGLGGAGVKTGKIVIRAAHSRGNGQRHGTDHGDEAAIVGFDGDLERSPALTDDPTASSRRTWSAACGSAL